MEVRPAQQLSREAPQELYRAALAANDAHRSLALMAAAAELRHPLACDKMKAQSDLWRSISMMWQCLNSWGEEIPASVMHLAPPCAEPAGHRQIGMPRTLEGWANEFGVLPGATRAAAIRCYLGYDSAGPYNAIAAERLSALNGSGMGPFRIMFLESREGPTHVHTALATRTLCAAAAARSALTPLLARTEKAQAHRTPLNACALFDGLFAALAAASQKHAASALLLARVLHRRFGKEHLMTAKAHYEAAARGWSFDACIALMRMGDERVKALATTCAIGAEEEAEVQRVLGGGMSVEEERLSKGEWLMLLPPNADAVVRAVLSIGPYQDFVLSEVAPNVAFACKALNEELLGLRCQFHHAPVRAVNTGDVTHSLPVGSLTLYANDTPVAVAHYANVAPHLPHATALLAHPISSVRSNAPADTAKARPTGSVATAAPIPPPPLIEAADRLTACETWVVCCKMAFTSEFGGAVRCGGSLVPWTDACNFCRCDSGLLAGVQWSGQAMCVSCFIDGALPVPGIELYAAAVASATTQGQASRAVTRLLSPYENLTAEGALREWPFWVTYAQFEALYELRPPRDMQRVAWLEHLCATRFFFGRISTEAASGLVRAEAGLFVLRMSSVAGCLTVSVGLGQGRVQHHRVQRSEGGGFVVASAQEGEREVATLREALACGKGAWGLVRGAGASPYRRAMGADVPDPYADFCP